MENPNIRKDTPSQFMNNPSQANPENQQNSSTKTQRTELQINKFNDDLGQSLRTLRMLEERYSTLRKKMQVSDQNIIEDTNKTFTQLKLIVKDISDLKMKIEDMRLKLEMFSSEIKEMAKSQDLKVIQRYLEMWEPMQFLTEKQAIQLIRDALKEKEIKENSKKT